MNPICVECNMSMDRTQSGVTALLYFLYPPEPYKAYHADQFTCPGCGVEIVADFAERPMWEHHNDEAAPKGVDVIAMHERPQETAE